MSSPTDRHDKPDDQIAEREFPQRNEQSVPKEGPISDQARAHRPLDTASLRETEPPPAPRALGRLAVLAGLAIAALIGAALALFITGKFPSEFNEMPGLSADKTAVVSSPASETLKTPEQLSSPAARPPSASTDPRPIGEDTARAASVRDASERAPTFRGVTDKEIKFGISAPATHTP